MTFCGISQPEVQAKIPNGMKPGQTFTVQYTPIAPATTSTSWTANPGAWCGKMIRMSLAAISIVKI